MPTQPPEVTIADRKIGLAYPPYIVAEISGNHLRDKKRARLIFAEAKRAGVDAVKIQTYTPDSLAIPIAPDKLDSMPQWKENWGWKTGSIYELYEKVYTPQGEFTDFLFALGEEFSLPVFSTPFSVKDAIYLAERFNPPAYKIGALECDFFPLLEVIAKTKKPILLNVCIAGLDIITRTLDFLKRMHSGPVVLLTGPKIYHGDAAKNFLLGRLAALKDQFSHAHVLGLSDHFLRGVYNDTYYQGYEFDVAGVLQYGASLVEKHFCGCRSGVDNDVDGQASIVTEEMLALVYWVKAAYRKRQGEILSAANEEELGLIQAKADYGFGEKMIGPSWAEIECHEAEATRLIYANRALQANVPLQLDDLHFSRAIHHAHPEAKRMTFLPTSTVPQVLGNSLKYPIEKGDPIFAESLQGPIDLDLPYEGVG